MKKILLRMLLPVLALVLVTSCEKDILHSTKILQDLY